MKWLRYYFDFCYEYHHESASKESLSYFLQKLQDKKQNNQQQRQASDAILLYYEIALSNYKNKIATKMKYNEPIRKRDQFKSTNADWTLVYDDGNGPSSKSQFLDGAFSGQPIGLELCAERRSAVSLVCVLNAFRRWLNADG